MGRCSLLTLLPLALLLLAGACGGGGSSPPQEAAASLAPAGAPLIMDAERVALTTRDVPLNFQQVPGGALHLSSEDICRLGNPSEAEQQDCLGRQREWKRLDSYQVLFQDESLEAGLSGAGVFEILFISSAYQDRQGVAQAFAWGKAQLLRRIDGAQGATLVSTPTVGEESLAFVVNSPQRFRGRDVPMSFYTVDFRRGNVLVRVTTVAPQVLAKVDDVLSLARLLDGRILKGGEESAARQTASPTPTVAPSP